MDDAPVNLEGTRSGRVRPVCEFCGRKGRAVMPDGEGRVGILELGQGWAVAPYPAATAHHDGSTGDLFTCPTCRALLSRGDTLTSRAYLHRSTEHEGAVRAAERAKSALRERGAID